MKWDELKHGYADRIAQLARLSPHQLLGVEVGASKEDVRAAYLRLVRAYHPDRADPFMARNNGEMMKLINAAYDKLKDGG